MCVLLRPNSPGKTGYMFLSECGSHEHSRVVHIIRHDYNILCGYKLIIISNIQLTLFTPVDGTPKRFDRKLVAEKMAYADFLDI